MPIIFHGRNRLGLYLSPMKMCCSQQHICLRIILLMDGWMDGQHDSIQFRVIIPLIILFFQDALFLFTLLSMRYVRFLKARIISVWLALLITKLMAMLVEWYTYLDLHWALQVRFSVATGINLLLKIWQPHSHFYCHVIIWQKFLIVLRKTSWPGMVSAIHLFYLI